MQLRSIHTLVLFCFLTTVGSMGLLMFSSERIEGSHPSLLIVCTTGMIADMVGAIAGPHAHITVLMGSGIDPHLYRATESNVHVLAAADLIVCNGLHLEGKMVDVFSHLQGQKRILCLGDMLAKKDLIPLSMGCGFDPHIWHDVVIWRHLISFVCEELITLDPKHRDDFIRAATVYDAQLSELNTWIHTMIETIPLEHRILVTAHDAFAYFGKRYGIRVMGLQGVSTESEIALRDVQELASFIGEQRIPALFFESSIPERTIKAVQEAVISRGYRVRIGRELLSDALGDVTHESHTYRGMIMWNVKAMVEALSGNECI